MRGLDEVAGGAAVADVLGRRGVYRDPLWRVTVELTALEQELLSSWWVRRLRFISHAGPASYATVQSYSRLEHSLGLLCLTAHFAPSDNAARLAALLHDIGHLPFSHTFEGVAGLDHHTIGRQRITGDLASTLLAHAVDPHEIAETAAGARPSVLASRRGLLKLDHLDSMMRSGRAHGRTREAPQRTLGRLDVDGGTVTTDVDTARYLADLVAAEARWVCSQENLVSTGVIRHLAALLLEGAPAQARHEIAQMTDDEFWVKLLHDRRTRAATARLRENPLWEVRPPSDDPSPGINYSVPRLYLDLPLVDGRQQPSLAETVSGLPPTPWTRTIVPPSGVHLRPETPGSG